jgi:hemophore-related protein
MKKLSVTSALAVGGLGLSLTVGAGVASADPIVDSTCSFEQVVAAANAQGPMAARFISNPQQQAGLRQFLSLPPNQRQQMANQIRTAPSNAVFLPTIETVFNVCNNY